jgi:predicted enzyme involved in methoxymalonyl-ACP biosynthesis
MKMNEECRQKYLEYVALSLDQKVIHLFLEELENIPENLLEEGDAEILYISLTANIFKTVCEFVAGSLEIPKKEAIHMVKSSCEVIAELWRREDE